LYPRSHATKSSTSVLRHIHDGKRPNPRSASSAVESPPCPRTYRFTRYASGQSASTATAQKPNSSISRRVIAARAA